jgi:hypothetical protein
MIIEYFKYFFISYDESLLKQVTKLLFGLDIKLVSKVTIAEIIKWFFTVNIFQFGHIYSPQHPIEMSDNNEYLYLIL